LPYEALKDTFENNERSEFSKTLVLLIRFSIHERRITKALSYTINVPSKYPKNHPDF